MKGLFHKPFKTQRLPLELRRHREREARRATLTVRTTTLEFQPPHPERERPEPVSLQVILAVEDNPPPGEKPVCWLLLTTLAVSCFEDVVEILRILSSPN